MVLHHSASSPRVAARRLLALNFKAFEAARADRMREAEVAVGPWGARRSRFAHPLASLRLWPHPRFDEISPLHIKLMPPTLRLSFEGLAAPCARPAVVNG